MTFEPTYNAGVDHVPSDFMERMTPETAAGGADDAHVEAQAAPPIVVSAEDRWEREFGGTPMAGMLRAERQRAEAVSPEASPHGPMDLLDHAVLTGDLSPEDVAEIDEFTDATGVSADDLAQAG